MKLKKLLALLCAVMMLAGLFCLPVAAGSDDGFNDVELGWPCTHANLKPCHTACPDCLEPMESTGEHVYTDAKDVTCNVCGTYRVVITTQPKTTYAKEGAKISVNVTADGDGLTYTWYFKNASAKSFSKSSITSATYSTTMRSTTKNRQVYCIVKDKYGNAVQTATVTLCEAASIATQPKTTYAKEGAKISVKVVAKGDGLTYTWYFKNASSKSFSKSSTTAATYSTTMSSTTKDRQVYCVVKDEYGNSVKSSIATLRRQATITKEPVTSYAKKGAKVSVKVTAVGDGLTYTWYYKNSGKKSFTKSSTKTATYSTTMSSTTKNRQVYCIVKDKHGKTVQSKNVTLRESVSITTQPKTVTVKKNATAKVTVKASGDGLTYTWYYKNSGKKTFTKASTKTASYSVKMTATTKNRQVYCVVKDKYGKTVKTVTVTLKMK